ncbi:acetylglutamate kinase [Thermococcus eurythermalis]|uniref:Isopentenyl phosphate kinase n=1 Tax=Thermococcus eurythermalis TaxID=1505907 RepID=A0A097QTN7_9EURY|nr:isopentenyl phosphate kinase [Thermococcus eurythermalis]AIU69824.1 acetylglutamate kinase [Thermococcus eurythermalis]
MIIVKIGGSVFSDKRGEPENFRENVVRSIAGEIKDFYPEEDFIIVHGGGSFGHPYAKEYRIREGLTGLSEAALFWRKKGFSLTHHAMLRANMKIVETFINAGLPAVSVSSSSVFLMDSDRVVYGDVEPIRKLIETDFIPVLFGDVAVDLMKGIDILSGDQIVTYLTKLFTPKKVVFLMSVDGIYDGVPGEGTLLQEIPADNIDHIIKRISGSAGTDVTGGIINKLKEAKEIARFSEVWFVNGLVPGRLSGAIRGDGFGTRIVP